MEMIRYSHCGRGGYTLIAVMSARQPEKLRTVKGKINHPSQMAYGTRAMLTIKVQ